MSRRLALRANALRQFLPKKAPRLECLLLSRATCLSQSTAQIPTLHTIHGVRNFSQNPILLKKKRQVEIEEEEVEPKKKGEVEDPFDFSTLEEGIEKAREKLKDGLLKIRTGGRFNPEILENVRVHLVKDSKDTERLGDLAQVLPKGGRSLMILVGEKEYIKPIMSAIQSSKDLNLQPQPDAQNPSQLNVPIPPPTKESRDLALATASKTGESAHLGVKNARAAMQKRLRAMELRRTVRPDDLKKAHKEMEKVVERGIASVKKSVDAARKAMEQT